MKKLYAGDVYVYEEEATKLLYDLSKILADAKEILSEDSYNDYTIMVHKYIRTQFNVDDKLFCMASKKDDPTQVMLLTFDKKADGKHYTVHKDEDGKPYILVDED